MLEGTLNLYEKNKSESEKKIKSLRSDLKVRAKRSETHSASPAASKSSSAKNLHAAKSDAEFAKNSKPKPYMPSYLSHGKPSIKRNNKNSK